MEPYDGNKSCATSKTKFEKKNNVDPNAGLGPRAFILTVTIGRAYLLDVFSSTIRVIYAWEGVSYFIFPTAHKTRLKWSLSVL